MSSNRQANWIKTHVPQIVKSIYARTGDKCPCQQAQARYSLTVLTHNTVTHVTICLPPSWKDQAESIVTGWTAASAAAACCAEQPCGASKT